MASKIKVCEDPSTTFNGWATTGHSDLKPFSYHPRPLGPKDIEVEISFCGLCGSEIHHMTGGFGVLEYSPCILGHEIIGKVVALGDSNTSQHKIGDIVGIGAMVDSCGDCKFCKDDGDHFCRHKTFTFNDIYKDGRGGLTYGGIADRIRLNGAFAFKIPPQISPAEAAPLLCAGITTYSPLKRFNAGPGKKVGVIGIGGLGHMALQWAHAMECDEVVAISTSDSKREESMKLGASKFVNLKNPEELQTLAGSLDIVLCTSFAKDTNWDQLLQLVAKHGTMVLLAIPEVPVQLTGITLLYNEISLTGSMIGGRRSFQEMLQFAADKGIRPWIEKMPMSDPDAAFKRLMEGRPRYRIVMETEAASRL